MINNILLPEKFQIVEDKQNPYSLELTIEPCAPGYGLTIGNSLRRILLSSLVGGAAFAVKIKGVKHEFDTIAGVKEDVIEMIINIKKLVLKVHTNEVVILALGVPVTPLTVYTNLYHLLGTPELANLVCVNVLSSPLT